MRSPKTPAIQQKPTPLSAREALITQLCVGPDFTEVASALLKTALSSAYPNIDIDPNLALVGTPVWEIVEDEVTALPPFYQALSDILIRQALLNTSLVYLEGEHFLTQLPSADPVIHLPVRIGEISSTVNLLARLMPDAYQKLQLDFWNTTSGDGPQWHELSKTLRGIWNVDQVAGWTDDDCRMARHLFNAADLSSRKINNPYNSQACLIDFDEIDGLNLKHPKSISLAVLIGTQPSGTSILMFSILNGYEKFDSLQALGSALLAHLIPSSARKEIQWRLFEPEGHFFDQQACVLMSMQIEAIGEIFSATIDPIGEQPSAVRQPVHGVELLSQKGQSLQWYYDLLPAWLLKASSSDLSLYSRRLKDLVAMHSLNAGQSYLDDILPIKQFALKALKDEMVKAHADAEQLELEAFEIRVRSQVIWGYFSVPGKTETRVFSFVELALENLIALPIGNKTLYSKNGKPPPTWMTVSYIETLISRINIGSTYPALVKRTLLDDPGESLRRQALYTRQLQTQLPLLALQCKINNQAGIDERGCRYVAAILQPDVADRQVEGQLIVVRPLAFAPERRGTDAADVVSNMFVIGPQDLTAGPCLLYRPMLDQPLTQYPTFTNLLYAIQQSPSLRNSVLAWLADDVRSDYERYVFPGKLPSPWTVAEFAVEPDKLWTMSGPMSLGTQVISGDLFAALFNANANALVGLADRQSVSNTESRWATFKQSGWLIFNMVLPFLGRTVGITTWIWQIVDQLQALVEATEQGEKKEQWGALVDVLLNLSMAVTLHIASRSEPVGERVDIESVTLTTPLKNPTVVKQAPEITVGERLPSPYKSLHTNGALNRDPGTLATVLDSFKIAKPEGVGNASTVIGAHHHLYPLRQHWYAPVGQHWFEVTVDENGLVLIIDPKVQGRTGPALISNARGQWFIDTRLRLRAGGLKSLNDKAKAELAKTETLLRMELGKFESEKKSSQEQLQKTRQEMTDAPSTSVSAKRQLYLQKLEAQRTDYETALQKLKALNVSVALPDYQQRSISYIKAQLDLTQAGITEALTTFTPTIRTVLDQIERQSLDPQVRHIEDAQVMNEMSQDMIERLDYLQERFVALKALGKQGMLLIQSTKKTLPSYTSDDLRALQVMMSRNLCLRQDTTTTSPAAWAAIDSIVDNADIAIQSLRDSLEERSEARLDERIDTLSGLYEQFNSVDERLQDFQQEFPVPVQLEHVASLRQQVKGFNQRAMTHLVILLGERTLLRSRPSTPQFTPRPKRTFIRTLYNGVLIGEPRLSALGLETHLVDIKSPFTSKVLATFHEKIPGVWVQRIETSQSVPVPQDLQASVDAGQALLDGVAAFNTRAAEQMNRAGRTPMGVEFLFHQQALKLERASSAIDQSLTNANLTESSSIKAASVNKALSTATQNIYTQAHIKMLNMIKEQPPIASSIEWLNNRKKINIKKTVSRRRISRSAKYQYLDEYAISDRVTHKVLWYAHFQYSTSWTPSKSFITARLKTVEEQSRGPAADITEGLNEAQQIAFNRSEINLQQASRLFFAL